MSATVASSVFPTNINIASTRLGIHDLPEFDELNSRERHLLHRFIRNVWTGSPESSFRVSILNLVDALHVSRRTVQRTIKGLVDKGWITRTQVQKWSGMEIADTKLTDKALKVLGFLDPKPTKSSVFRAPKVAHAYKDSISSTVLQRHLDKPSSKNIQIEEEKPKETRVPSDLQCLLQLGLSAPAIFKLMKFATRAGQRLGVIVKAVKDALKDAKNIYAYIRDLIKQQRDWSEKPKQPVHQKVSKETLEQQEAQAQRQRALDAQKQRQDATKRLLAIFTEHKLLVNEAGSKIWTVMSDCVFYFPIEDLHKKQLQRRNIADNNRNAELIRAFEEGKLMPYDPNRPVRGQGKATPSHTASSSQPEKPPARYQGFQKIDRLFPSLDDFETLF